MISSACATARYGPWICLLVSACETAISTAPPPANSFGSSIRLRATCSASCRLRSVSFSTSFDAPRSKIVHAFGSLHSVTKQKYSSPSFLISNRPAPVPTSFSVSSSVRFTIVAPQARANRLLSVLRNRRIAVMPAFSRKCCAKSDTPFSVNTTSGLTAIMSSHRRATCSSSSCSSFVKS
uniref:Putative secreted peptide n=1 Tax=Anopheles braziliensis TaxID=58242 RepID=A0A2M3ZEI1_9DIPT